MLSLAVAASVESYNVKMRAHGLCRPVGLLVRYCASSHAYA